MKKIMTVILSLSVFLTMPAMVFGASSYSVSLSTIDSIVSQSSSYARDAVDKQNAEQSSYNYYASALIEETKSLNSYNARLQNPDPNDDYDKLLELIKACQDNIASYKSQMIQSQFNISQISMDNSMSLAQQGETAKEAYIKYLQALDSRNDLRASITREKKKVRIARRKYKKGIISRSALNTEKQALEDLSDQMDDINAQISDAHAALIDALGVADDSSLQVHSLSAADLSAFAAARKYNYTADAASVLSNSVELRKARATVNYQASRISTAADANEKVKATADYNDAVKNLNVVTEKARKSFKSQYDSLQSGIKSVLKNDKKIARAKKSRKIAARKYRYGLISRNEYRSAADAYKEAQIARQKAIVDLLPQIMKYQLTVKGY